MKLLPPLSGSVLTILIAVATAGPAQAKEAKQGYLSPDAVEIVKILPPAPHEGDPRYQADREIFKATRRFVGTPRWTLATRDAELSTADMLAAFSCSVGVALTRENAPTVAKLIDKAGVDTSGAVGVAKDYFKRRRPFLIDHGEICQPEAELAGTFDYPSGHTTRGWTWAELLAELAPDHAGAILARGRAFGESRIVCGAHNSSAVEAGRLTAASVLAAVHSSPAFQTDFQAAKAELGGLRADAHAPKPEGCAEETQLIAEPVL